VTQGGYANSSGGALEKAVIGALTSKGFQLVSFGNWQAHPERYAEELLLRNAPYQTIYRHPGHTEFLLVSRKHAMRIRIECKWQQTAGSVDEKFPYLYLNAVEAMPENDIIIVVDGGGYKKGALDWLKDAAREKRYMGEAEKTIRVMSLAEFLTWANTAFR